MQSFETVICPRCGKPFPKKRQELGYNFCCNCSEVEPVMCLVESSTDGDGDDTVHTGIHIISKRQVAIIDRAQNQYRSDSMLDENDLDMRTIEDQESQEISTYVIRNGNDVEEDLGDGFEELSEDFNYISEED